MSYPLNCTKPCQQCYEKVIAGVKEYRCYGQCVVVDQMGIKHNGPGEAAPADWTLCVEVAEVTEEMVAYMALYNNQQTSTIINETNCFSKGKPCHLCTTNCWINRFELPFECHCGEQPKLQDGTPNPKWKKFKNPNVDRPTQTTEEEQKAALATARSNFNKRIGGDTPVPVIPKQYTTVECDPKWCTCQGVEGCGDAAKCGGQCHWVNHPRVGGTKEPPPACTSCNFKCSQKGNPPESDEDDTVIRETEQVPKVALAKARKAANFDRNSTTPTMGGSCLSCLGNICGGGETGRETCWHRQIGTDTGNITWECKCVPSTGPYSNPNLPTPGGWIPKVFDRPSASVASVKIPPTPMY